MNTRIFLHAVIVFLIINNVFIINGFAQTSNSDANNNTIKFPDIPGYLTLKCDFHQHTVFSDGEVWPSIRVKEAVKDGLDAISITDHIEWLPHQNDIPNADKNRIYQIAKKKVNGKDVTVLNGAEITRGMPPGHLNAIFLKDVNKLVQDDSIEVLKEAKNQGAFIFWNHPHWIAHKPDGMAELTELHKELINNDLIHGIEIVNSRSYSDEAFQIAIDNNLTILGNSDIHGLIEWEYKKTAESHRPLTLVFAKEKTEKSIKEALENQRTAVWFNNTLFGNDEYLIPLIQNSLIVKKVELLTSHKGNSLVQSVYIENISSMDYILENNSEYTMHSHAKIFKLNAHEETIIQVKTLQDLSSFILDLKVLNAFIAPNKKSEIQLKIEK
ncbi:Sb-PDE family phosphodiesterase [Bacteroidota bacterium]